MLIYFILIPILASVIIYLIPKLPIGFFVLGLEAVLFYFAWDTLLSVESKGLIRQILGAENAVLGIELVADKQSVVFLILTIFLFSIAFIYTMKESFFNKKFVLLFLILQGLLSGIFVSDDLFNLYVLLEVATVVVAILIMFKRDSCSIYDGMVYLLSQILCMTFYLFGIGYLYKIFGVLSLSKIRELMPLATQEQLVLPFAFIMTAVCLKSAFFPLFSWLPRAHGTPSAPSAVSAILSGLYVKNGIYLYLTFSALFEPVIDSSLVFIIIGAMTAIGGFSFAIIQSDLKLILAYSTVSQMGLLAIGFSIPSEISRWGASYHIMNHAVFKALLFLAAGAIIKEYKTRDLHEIRGVMKRMPVMGIATLIGVLGIMGAPILNGSISKYFIQYGAKRTWIEVLILLINFGTILCFVKYSTILFGEGKRKRKVQFSKQIAVVILAVSCVIGGIFGVELMNFMYDTDLVLERVVYIEKAAQFMGTLALAILCYRYVVCKNTWIYRYQTTTLNFLQIVVAMVAFFITMLFTTSI